MPPLAWSQRYFAGWPCALLQCDASKGRYLVATQDLSEGDVVLISEAYLSMILSSFKKRVCCFCHTDFRRRLSAVCSGCHQAHWCSPECMEAHLRVKEAAAVCSGMPEGSSICTWRAASACSTAPGSQVADALSCLGLGIDDSESSGSVAAAGMPGAAAAGQPQPRHDPLELAPRSAAMVPHSLLCGVLRQFSSVKWSADVESVILGVLQLLAMEHLEGGAHPSKPAQPQQQEQQQVDSNTAVQAIALQLSHADFLRLQGHAADWDARDRADWLKASTQFVGMLRRAGWPGRVPSPEEVVDHAGRITSNNFGIYAPAGPRRPAGAGNAEAAQQGQQQQQESSPGGAKLGGTEGQQPAAAQPGSRAAPMDAAALSVAAAAEQQQQQEERHAEQQGQESKTETIGRELYITASFFNHSCEPNCLVHRGFKAATVVARRPIQAGEELTISYLGADPELPRSARRNHLRKFFHFDCDCPRCEWEAVEGSARCSYSGSKGKTRAPKKRGRKARVSRS